MNATRRNSRKSVNGKKAPATTVENLFFSRDESWMRFNQRVLEEAADETNPLLERVKFLAIFAGNLDEFYMVRIAGLKRRQNTGLTVRSPDGLSIREQLTLVSARTQDLVQRHELRAILLGRFLVALRGPVYLAIGAAKLPAWKFFALNTSVAIVEVAIIVGLGYAFGASHELAHEVRWLEIVVGIALVLAFVVIPYFVKRHIERRQPA